MALDTSVESSGFRFYSVGRVAANKKRGSFLIEAVPIETIPHLSGEVTDNETKTNTKIESKDGSDAKDIELSTTSSIQAEWLPVGNTNRITAPDVRRGEFVMLYKFGDAEVIYWEEFKQMNILRRLETVTYIFSNERNENIPLDETNVYMMSVSTHDKHITVTTSKSDGEPFAYTFQINTKDGFFTIQDDDGNYVFMDSKERHIKLRNKDDSFVELNKRIINITSKDEVNIKTKRYSLEATESVKEQTKTHIYKSQTYTLDVNAGYRLTAGTYNTKSSDNTFEGNITFKNNATTDGNSTVNGNSRINGTAFEANSSGPGNSK